MSTTNINTLLHEASIAGASDMHLVVGKPPLMRVDGEIIPIMSPGQKEEPAPLGEGDVAALIREILPTALMERFETEREMDMSHQLPNGTRIRVNCHYERGYMGLVARVIPEAIPTLEQIFMPEIVRDFARATQGIILFTGPTGSGKSTSLAAIMDEINRERSVHIVTIEDPIEFLYHQKKAVIRQRQYGTDFLSYEEALRRVLRQDPDVILVGEMRDLETIAAALTLAETGHLVFGTLHTNNAAQTIDRVIDVFPPHQQAQIRTQLSMTLRGVVAQRLIPRKGGGRVAVREVMLNSPAIANIIRDNRVAELSNVIQTSAELGMITVERDAARLYQEGLIEKSVAAQFVKDTSNLKELKPQKKGFFGR